MDKFWDVIQAVGEIAVLLLFAGAIYMVGSMMSGVH